MINISANNKFKNFDFKTEQQREMTEKILVKLLTNSMMYFEYYINFSDIYKDVIISKIIKDGTKSIIIDGLGNICSNLITKTKSGYCVRYTKNIDVDNNEINNHIKSFLNNEEIDKNVIYKTFDN